MATKVEDRFKQQKTYEGFESEAKASGLYDTFDAKDLERAKTDASYGYDLLNYKKGWTTAHESGDKEGEEFYAGMGQALRDSHDAKYTSKTSVSGTPTYSGALAAIKAYDDSLPGDKSSKYLTMIDSLLSDVSKDKFSYDAKSDPRYVLAEEYAQRAMENQMAESALLTGGYGNSFGAAAGQQVYSDVMREAESDLEADAYARWAAERDNKYNLLGIAQSAKTPEVNEPSFTAEQALSYYVGGNRSAKVLEAMLYHFGEDYAVNADAYYKNMTAQKAKAPVVNGPNSSITLAQALSEAKAGRLSEAGKSVVDAAYGEGYYEKNFGEVEEENEVGYTVTVDRNGATYKEYYGIVSEGLKHRLDNAWAIATLQDAVKNGLTAQEAADIAKRLELEMPQN